MAPMFDAWASVGRPSLDSSVAKKSVDLIHYTAPLAPSVGTIPVTATVHDVFPLAMPDLFPRRGRRIMAASLHTMAERAVSVAFSSDQTRREAIHAGFRSDRARVIPLGVRIRDVTKEQRAEVRRRFHLARPFVMWVGTLEPRKNPATVLALADTVAAAGCDLVLVGPTGWSVDPAWTQEADRHPAIRRLGKVSDADLDALYTAARLFVFPSLAEGFGLPVLEAMAHHTACVTSAGTATAEVLGDCGPAVDARDIAGWRREVERLLSDATIRRRCADLGVVRAKEFNWDRTATAMVEMWHAAVESAARQ